MESVRGEMSVGAVFLCATTIFTTVRPVLTRGAESISTSSVAAQEYSTAFPREAGRKVRESERFVIWDVTWEKGKSTGMQKLQLDQASVTLTEGAIKITKPDGTWSIEQERFGSVRLESKGTVEAEEGVSDTPSRAVVFQLKDAVPAKWPTTEGIPGAFPRIGAVKLFETDRINVWDSTWMAGKRIALHLHYTEAAAVFLEGGQIRNISGQGLLSPPFSRKRGEVIIHTSPLKAPHQEEAVEGEPRAIWIEFK